MLKTSDAKVRRARQGHSLRSYAVGRGAGLGRGLGVTCGRVVGVGLAVAVDVALGVVVEVAVAVGVGVGGIVAVGVDDGVTVPVGVGVGVNVAVAVGVHGGPWHQLMSIVSTRQPSLEALLSLAILQRNLPSMTIGGNATVVVIKPPELPLHARRPAIGLPRSELIVRL